MRFYAGDSGVFNCGLAGSATVAASLSACEKVPVVLLLAAFYGLLCTAQYQTTSGACSRTHNRLWSGPFFFNSRRQSGSNQTFILLQLNGCFMSFKASRFSRPDDRARFRNALYLRRAFLLTNSRTQLLLFPGRKNTLQPGEYCPGERKPHIQCVNGKCYVW